MIRRQATRWRCICSLRALPASCLHSNRRARFSRERVSPLPRAGTCSMFASLMHSLRPSESISKICTRLIATVSPLRRCTARCTSLYLPRPMMPRDWNSSHGFDTGTDDAALDGRLTPLLLTPLPPLLPLDSIALPVDPGAAIVSACHTQSDSDSMVLVRLSVAE